MRYTVESEPNSEREGATIYVVKRKSDGLVFGQHATKESADKQWRGLCGAALKHVKDAKRLKREAQRRGVVPCYHPSQDRDALESFLQYAEGRVDHAPMKEVQARLALSWLRGLVTLQPKESNNG